MKNVRRTPARSVAPTSVSHHMAPAVVAFTQTHIPAPHTTPAPQSVRPVTIPSAPAVAPAKARKGVKDSVVMVVKKNHTKTTHFHVGPTVKPGDQGYAADNIYVTHAFLAQCGLDPNNLPSNASIVVSVTLVTK